MRGRPPLFQFIKTAEQLDVFFEASGRVEILSLDTEFSRDRTYYPTLCLLQIATHQGIALIDALAIPSHSRITEALTANHPTKILHAGRQDIEVLHLNCGVLPQNIKDTQIAAAFCGYGDQIGYARLVFEVLGVELEKAHTRTDWTQRPLRPEQLIYAAEDVAFLGAIHEILHERLETLDRLAWLEEECDALLQPQLYTCEPLGLWRKISMAYDLDGESLYRLKHLVAWRETAAQGLNLPRNWTARDEWLCRLASSPNAPLNAIEENPSIPSQQRSGVTQSLRDTLIQLAENPGAETPPPEWAYRPDDRRKLLLKKLSGIVRAESEKLAIPASLLASKKDLEILIDQPTKSRLSGGWRADLFGANLLNAIDL